MYYSGRIILFCALCISATLARPQNNNNWFSNQFPNFPSLQPQPQQQPQVQLQPQQQVQLQPQQQQALNSLFIDTQNLPQSQQQPQVLPQPQQPQGDVLLRTTTATPTTASPQYLTCLQTCPSTMEYNPVCGSDGIDYHNNGRLQCANFCGRTVTALRMGTCEPL